MVQVQERLTPAVEKLGRNYTTKVDEVDANTTYIGNAFMGSPVTEAKWQIQKITVSGTVTTIAWAGGNDEFNKVWNDRAALIYS